MDLTNQQHVEGHLAVHQVATNLTPVTCVFPFDQRHRELLEAWKRKAQGVASRFVYRIDAPKAMKQWVEA